jgi:hypothetical protein
MFLMEPRPRVDPSFSKRRGAKNQKSLGKIYHFLWPSLISSRFQFSVCNPSENPNWNNVRGFARKSRFYNKKAMQAAPTSGWWGRAEAGVVEPRKSK